MTGKADVAVVDSGWDWSLESSRVRSGLSLIGGHCEEFTADTQDRHGHGTACCHVIWAQDENLTIAPVRVFDRTLRAPTARLLQAIGWCIEKRIRVVSMSLSSSDLRFERHIAALCARASGAGLVLIAAGRGALRCLPAALPGVIGVRMTADLNGVSFSYDQDSEYRFAASGIHSVPGLGGETRTFVGPSFAVPVVAGMAASFLKAQPSASARDVELYLRDCARSRSATVS